MTRQGRALTPPELTGLGSQQIEYAQDIFDEVGNAWFANRLARWGIECENGKMAASDAVAQLVKYAVHERQLDRDAARKLIAEEFVDEDVDDAWAHEERVLSAYRERQMRDEVERRYNTKQLESFNNRVVSGIDFIRSHAGSPPALWGSGSDVLWAKGEALTITAGFGVGKTTLAGLLVRAQIFGGEVLGYPVKRLGDGLSAQPRILYLACDRPEQIGRSQARQFADHLEDAALGALTVWRGPIPADAAVNTNILVDLANYHQADVVYIDSLKDVARGIAEDRVGAAYQLARQTLLASGRQLCELHHLNKSGDDYGSVWVAAGSGSVVRLSGKPGGQSCTLTHIKQPAHVVGPLTIQQDRDNGEMAVSKTATAGPSDAAAVVQWVREYGAALGVTAVQAAHQFYGGGGRNEIERARRALMKLSAGDNAELSYLPGSAGGAGEGRQPSRWAAKDAEWPF